jgi:hypothetical protein
MATIRSVRFLFVAHGAPTEPLLLRELVDPERKPLADRIVPRDGSGFVSRGGVLDLPVLLTPSVDFIVVVRAIVSTSGVWSWSWSSATRERFPSVGCRRWRLLTPRARYSIRPLVSDAI